MFCVQLTRNVHKDVVICRYRGNHINGSTCWCYDIDLSCRWNPISALHESLCDLPLLGGLYAGSPVLASLPDCLGRVPLLIGIIVPESALDAGGLEAVCGVKELMEFEVNP